MTKIGQNPLAVFWGGFSAAPCVMSVVLRRVHFHFACIALAPVGLCCGFVRWACVVLRGAASFQLCCVSFFRIHGTSSAFSGVWAEARGIYSG
jgi:hypothetical protein